MMNYSPHSKYVDGKRYALHINELNIKMVKVNLKEDSDDFKNQESKIG